MQLERPKAKQKKSILNTIEGAEHFLELQQVSEAGETSKIKVPGEVPRTDDLDALLIREPVGELEEKRPQPIAAVVGAIKGFLLGPLYSLTMSFLEWEM